MNHLKDSFKVVMKRCDVPDVIICSCFAFKEIHLGLKTRDPYLLMWYKPKRPTEKTAGGA